MKVTNLMKSTLGVCVALFYVAGAFAEDKDKHDHDHDHDHDHVIAGPNGGRVLVGVEPHLEFFVTKDGKVQITAVTHDEKPKAIELGEQSVKVIAGKRTKPTRLAFAKEGKVLVSDGTLPEGKNFPVVVQIKTSPDAKTVIEKFQLNLNDCPTCDYLEYACTCDHGHDDHDHKDEKKKD